MAYHWYDFVGNVGVATILITYLLLQVGRAKIEDWRYSAANGLGAAFILISLYFSFNLSSFLIETAWLIISLFGLYRSLSARGK